MFMEYSGTDSIFRSLPYAIVSKLSYDQPYHALFDPIEYVFCMYYLFIRVRMISLTSGKVLTVLGFQDIVVLQLAIPNYLTCLSTKLFSAIVGFD